VDTRQALPCLHGLAAVAATPQDFFVFFKHLVVLHIISQLFVSVIMPFFSLGNHCKYAGDVVKALFAAILANEGYISDHSSYSPRRRFQIVQCVPCATGKPAVFSIDAGSSPRIRSKNLYNLLHALFHCRSFNKDILNLFVSFLIRNRSVISITVACLGLPANAFSKFSAV
jgi:hypothetical protein